MTRDELERCARFLSQGLDLDRQTQKRLVMHSLGTLVPPDHRQGCAFHRGDLCDCLETAPMDMGLKSALVATWPPPSKPGHWWLCAVCRIERGPFVDEDACHKSLTKHEDEVHR